MAAAEDVEAGADRTQRTAEAANADATTQGELPRIAQRDVVGQVDHVGGDLIATGGVERAGAIQRGVMLGEGELVLQAPAFGPLVAHGHDADGAVLRIDLCTAARKGASGGFDSITDLIVPAATKAQIPTVSGHCRCAESRGGNSRHGEHTKLHFSTLA